MKFSKIIPRNSCTVTSKEKLLVDFQGSMSHSFNNLRSAIKTFYLSLILQEIDGKALLSLSPEILMKGMNLKLGPAVKLYNHIVNLRAALSL